MKAPVRVTVTGAAGQIAYSLLFRIASGEMLGADQPVILQLLEIGPAMGALQGVVMELEDCAPPSLAGIEISDDPNVAFKDTDFALLVGAKPRGAGMERADLLEANAGIFTVQGRALNAHASRGVRVVVVGNPANTNALITMKSAPDLKPECFTALTRLDHNRAMAQLVAKLDTSVNEIRGLMIWGNHSGTQYPDLNHTLVGGEAVMGRLEQSWIENDFIPQVANRGAQIIKARGASSAASAANAALEHMRLWMDGTPAGDWTSMGVLSDGSYGIKEGLIYSFPVTTKDGAYTIVPDLPISEFSRARMIKTQTELEEERDAVAARLG